jgi:hypothetical protein
MGLPPAKLQPKSVHSHAKARDRLLVSSRSTDVGETRAYSSAGSDALDLAAEARSMLFSLCLALTALLTAIS